MERFLSYFTFYRPKKVALRHVKVGNNFVVKGKKIRKLLSTQAAGIKHL
jgi:hypothetical protein